jgi:hypothetical protein
MWAGQSPLTGISSSVEGVSSETPQRQLLEQLLHLLAPVDQGAQTGGPREAGYKLPTPAKPQLPKIPKPLDNATIIQRIRVSYPALRAARVDAALRQLFLAELITQVYNEGGSVVLPQGTRC